MLKIYGRSDDLILIELNGDILDEIGCHDTSSDKPVILACSDGTALAIWYDDDGCWRINRRTIGALPFEHTPAIGEDHDEYSDVVVLRGDVSWIVRGSEILRPRRNNTTQGD